MRIWIVTVLALALAGGCKGKKDEADKPDETPAAQDDAATAAAGPSDAAAPAAGELLAVWEAWLEAASSRDLEALAALYADDAVWIPAGTPPEHQQTGGKAIADNFSQFFSGFPDMKTDPMVVLVDPSTRRVAALSRVRGTNTEGMMGQPPSNKKTSFLSLQIMEIGADGTIVRETAYADNLNFMGHLGYWNGESRPVDEGDAPEAVVVTGGGELPPAVSAHVGSFNQHRAEALAALYADDGVLHRVDAVADDATPPEVRKAYQQIFDAYSDIEMSDVDIFRVGDYAVVTYTLTATNTGKVPRLGAKKATGKVFTTPGADLHRLTGDNKIAQTWSFVDGMAIASQLGLFPPPQ
jgi:steroid delta-isomerase-like uncharacterized protein